MGSHFQACSCWERAGHRLSHFAFDLSRLNGHSVAQRPHTPSLDEQMRRSEYAQKAFVHHVSYRLRSAEERVGPAGASKRTHVSALSTDNCRSDEATFQTACASD